MKFTQSGTLKKMSVSSELDLFEEILVPHGLTKDPISTASVMDVIVSMNLLTGECDRDPLLKDPITTAIQDVQIFTNLSKQEFEVSFVLCVLYYFSFSYCLLLKISTSRQFLWLTTVKQFLDSFSGFWLMSEF